MLNTVIISIEEYDELRNSKKEYEEFKIRHEEEIIKGDRYQEKINIFTKIYNKDKANTYMASDLFNILEELGLYNTYKNDRTVKIIDDTDTIRIIPYENLKLEDKEVKE